VCRGWDRHGAMKGQRRSSTRGGRFSQRCVKVQALVPIGGHRYGGSAGNFEVELQVDGGPWQQAKLRNSFGSHLGAWRFDWPVPRGLTSSPVRCVDGQRGAAGRGVDRHRILPGLPAFLTYEGSHDDWALQSSGKATTEVLARPPDRVVGVRSAERMVVVPLTPRASNSRRH